MNPEELASFYLERKRNGMDFSDIRLELENRGLTPSEISDIISFIDAIILNDLKGNSFRIKNVERYSIGIFLLSFGLIVTIGSLFNLVPIDGSYIIAWGPILAGVALLLNANGLRKTAKKSKFEKFKR